MPTEFRKEYECGFEIGWGKDRSWQLSGVGFAKLVESLRLLKRSSLGTRRRLRSAYQMLGPEVLLENFSYRPMSAGAMLHLACAALALGYGADFDAPIGALPEYSNGADRSRCD